MGLRALLIAMYKQVLLVRDASALLVFEAAHHIGGQEGGNTLEINTKRYFRRNFIHILAASS